MSKKARLCKCLMALLGFAGFVNACEDPIEPIGGDGYQHLMYGPAPMYGPPVESYAPVPPQTDDAPLIGAMTSESAIAQNNENER